MSKNKKQTGENVMDLAASKLRDKNASDIQKSLAGSLIAQSHTGKQTGKDMEAKASKALKNPNSSDDTKTLAASVLAQANKDR